MSHRLTIYGLVLAAALVVVGAESATAQQPLSGTVCQIFDNPARYNHKTVIIVSHIESDGFEFTGLVDGRCKHKPILLDFSTEAPEMRNLVNAIASPPSPGTVDKDISGTFIGRFELEPQEDGRERRVLRLRRVERLKVVRE